MNRPPVGRPPYLSFLPAFLFRPDERASTYILRAWLLAFLPSIVLAGLAGMFVPDAEPPDIQLDGAAMFFAVVIAAPVLETLLMVPPLLLLARLLGPGPAAIGSALLWAVLHSLAAPIWGFVIWWPFLILSVAMLTWRMRSWMQAILVVATIHALHNSLPAALVLLAGEGPAAG